MTSLVDGITLQNASGVVGENLATMVQSGLTAGYGVHTLYTTPTGQFGLYRIVYYISRTGGNASGGSFYFNFMWYDGFASQNAQSVGVSADTTGAQWASGTMTIYSADGQVISLDTSFVAPTSGTTRYDFHVALQRVTNG